MIAELMLAAAVGSSSVLLPASPEGIGIGDVDGDSKTDLVVLLVWPSWTSVAVSSSPSPLVTEVDVTPAIKDRRELWALRIENGRVEPMAPPLQVGREVLAIGPLEPAGPVVVLDDEGVSRCVVERDASGSSALRLQRIASLRPLMAGISTPLDGLLMLARLGENEPPRIVVPVSRGIAFLDEHGSRLDVESPFRDVSSGARGSIGFPLPRRIDLDRDGRFDLLSLDRSRNRAALARGLPDGSFSKPVIWDLRQLAEPDAPGNDDSGATERRFVDVLDSDGDGLLEAVIGFQQTEGKGMREGMKLMRGVPGEYRFYPLAADGQVATEPSAKVAIEGHPADFEHPESWVSPFRDLDGDGKPELLTITVKLGFFGVAKSAVTKKMKMGWVFHVYRREERVWREVSDAAPKFDFTADLDDLDNSRFARIPGDVDGDGRADMVQVAEREVRIHKGLPGPRFANRPSYVVRFEDAIRDFGGLVFVDLDGDGRRELIAFEQQPQEADQPARAVRLEVRTFGGEKK